MAAAMQEAQSQLPSESPPCQPNCSELPVPVSAYRHRHLKANTHFQGPDLRGCGGEGRQNQTCKRLVGAMLRAVKWRLGADPRNLLTQACHWQRDRGKERQLAGWQLSSQKVSARMKGGGVLGQVEMGPAGQGLAQPEH